MRATDRYNRRVHTKTCNVLIWHGCVWCSRGRPVIDHGQANPLFGPVYVEGAKPGDAVSLSLIRSLANRGGLSASGLTNSQLEIEFLEIKTAEFGWTGIFKGFGLLHASDFSEIDALRIWTIKDGYASTTMGSSRPVQVQIPIRPFCGEIGVARAEDGAHSAGESRFNPHAAIPEES